MRANDSIENALKCARGGPFLTIPMPLLRSRPSTNVAVATADDAPRSGAQPSRSATAKDAEPVERSGAFRISDLARPKMLVPSLLPPPQMKLPKTVPMMNAVRRAPPAEVMAFAEPPDAPRAIEAAPGPKRYGTVRMGAVHGAPSTSGAVPGAPASAGPASSNGRTLDENDFLDGAAQPVALELGAQPASRRGLIDPHQAGLGSDNVLGQEPRSRSSAQLAAVRAPQRTASGSYKAADARPGVFAFAGFGLPPESIVGAPAYALRALTRQRILRAGLATARARGGGDAELYEAALATVDGKAMSAGLFVLALFITGVLGSLVALGFAL